MTDSQERDEALRLGKDLSFIVAAWLENPGARPDLEPSAKLALKAWLEFEPNIARQSAPQQEPVAVVRAGRKVVWVQTVPEEGTRLYLGSPTAPPAAPNVVRDALLSALRYIENAAIGKHGYAVIATAARKAIDAAMQQPAQGEKP